MRRSAGERERRRCYLRHGHCRLVPCSLHLRGSGNAAAQSYKRAPVLALGVSLSQGGTAGLRLSNAGLGPAAITRTILTLDGESLGEYGEESVNVLRGKLSVRPAAVTFRKTILAADYDQFLLRVGPFDRTEHAEFADLLRHRLGLEIHYESLYGGEDYKAEWPRTHNPLSVPIWLLRDG